MRLSRKQVKELLRRCDPISGNERLMVLGHQEGEIAALCRYWLKRNPRKVRDAA